MVRGTGVLSRLLLWLLRVQSLILELATRDICIDLPHELAEVIGVRGAQVVVPPRNHDAIAEIRQSLFGRQNGPAH
jgi:hypothetical protein